MRKKLFWIGALAALVSGGTGYWVTNYACDHPSSWLGRCVMTGADAALWQAHTIRSAAATAESLASRASDGNAKAPVQVEAEVVVEADLPPAMLPGHIIIGESEEPRLADLPAPMAKVTDVTSAVPFVGGVEEAENAPMPQADEHEAKMPPCEDMPLAHRYWFGSHAVTGLSPIHEECEMPEAEKTPEKIAVMPKAVPEKIEVMPTLVPEGTVKPTHPKADTTEFRPGIDGGDFKFNGPY
jgi:hypothetical protein